MRKTIRVGVVVLSSGFLVCFACVLGMAHALGEAKSSGSKLSQAIIAYGFLRSNYADFDALLTSGPGLTVTRELKALERGLDSLECDVPTRLAFPHTVLTAQRLPPGQWVGLAREGRFLPEEGSLFVMQPRPAEPRRILVILSSVAPERTTVFWLEEGFATRLVYDSFSKGDVDKGQGTRIGAVIAVSFGKGNEVLLKEWAEPGSRGHASGAVDRVFEIDLTRGIATLKSPGMLPHSKPGGAPARQ